MNEFNVYVTIDANSGISKVRKLHFDNKTFFDVPEEMQDLSHHPLISSSPQYKSFKKSFDENSSKTKDSYIRNISFKIYDSKKNRTPEANAYIDATGIFVFKNQPLLKEQEFEKSAASIDLMDLSPVNKSNYSSSRLLQIYSGHLFNYILLLFFCFQ